MASSANDQSKPAIDHLQAFQPVTGRPPLIGYPQKQAVYKPDTPYHPYTAPPPPTDDKTNQPSASRYKYSGDRNSHCGGFRFLTVLVVLVVTSLVIGFIVWRVLLFQRPQVPAFRIKSFVVSNLNFSPSNSQLTAYGDVGITVRNPNKRSNTLFDRPATSIFYKNSSFGVTSSLQPFQVGTEDQQTVQGRFKIHLEELNDVLAKDMARDRSSGAVIFGVMIVVSTTFKQGIWFTLHGSMHVDCKNLKVVFLNASGEGIFMDAPRDCAVRLYDD